MTKCQIYKALAVFDRTSRLGDHDYDDRAEKEARETVCRAGFREALRAIWAKNAAERGPSEGDDLWGE